MDQERAAKVGAHLQQVVKEVNAITEEDITELIEDGERDTAIGPMMDPTAWQSGGKFEAYSQTKKVLNALLTFKKEVAGIGNFT